MRISVITPSVRPEFLSILAQCLRRQSVDCEWLIGSPEPLHGEIDNALGGRTYTLIKEPEKRSGDYYGLNKCWNELFRHATGDLIVNIVDGLWFDPTLLERLWNHYIQNPKACVTCVGDQFDTIENNKPEHMVWRDPRRRTDFGSFYEVPHTEMELCIASFPRQAVVDVGGVDEVYDQFAALSEKEMMARIYKAGYTLWIDQTIEYRAIKHDRLSEEWDTRYEAGTETYLKHMNEIESGNRVKLDFVKGK